MGRRERKRENKRELVGSWRSLHSAVWLLGLAILFWQNWFWPGILVLVAISLVIEAALAKFAPQAFAEESQPVTTDPVLASPPVVAPQPEHRAELLPTDCPKCGAPIRGHEVKWTGLQSADCPYCGANLPMDKV